MGGKVFRFFKLSSDIEKERNSPTLKGLSYEMDMDIYIYIFILVWDDKV